MAYRVPVYRGMVPIIREPIEGVVGPEIQRIKKCTKSEGMTECEYWIHYIQKNPNTGHFMCYAFSLNKKWREIDFDRLKKHIARICAMLDCGCQECHPGLYKYLDKD